VPAAAPPEPGGPLVSTAWLARRIGDPALRLYDCTLLSRPAADLSDLVAESGLETYRAGHIPGAAHLDVLALSDRSRPWRFALPEPADFAARAGRLGIGEGTEVVLYCRNHHLWAARIWMTLRHYGFAGARVLDGGWAKWTAEGRAVEAGERVHPSARFPPGAGEAVFVDKAAVRAAIGDPRVALVNALSPEQHAGTGGVHYGRAGRIPGSVNVPVRALTDPATTAFRPADELRQAFRAAGVLDRDRTIVYCGGGVAASGDALALALIGRPAQVYAVSLQEWARDPDCPLERDPA